MPECVPCPAAAPCAPSAGVKSGPRDGKIIDGLQDPCPCRTCCCGKPKIVKPCYKQPKIPDSYAPRRCYMKPSAPVESCTTYKLSYLPVDDCKNLRGEVRKPPPNLVPSCEPMESSTVQKLSYLPNPACVTQPIRPCHHDMWGQGPMQSITTQRHDYVPKPCVLRESCKPPPKFHCVEEPFENRTVNKLSYLPPERTEVVKSFAPERCYERPAAKMEKSTTHKLSYLPNQVMPKEPIPWACKGQYQKPCQKLEGNTTYMMSYLDAKSDCRRRAIIPDSCTNPVTVSKRFETQTIYKNSYLPACAAIPAPIKPQPNLVSSTAQMEGDTVHRLSYLPNPACVTQPIRPCHHDMWGQGPMQSITTQRHDYVPKPCVLRESCKPPPKFHCVEEPFENRTVNKLSYLPPERTEVVKSFAPERCYERPAAKMEKSTTHKLSYLPNQVMPKEPIPWACKGQYQKPCQKLEGNTTYMMSYLDAKSDCRRRAIIPDSCTNPVTVSKRFETQTIYKNSYLPACAAIPAPIKPQPNLVSSTAQMEGDTVHRLSYLPNPACVTQPIRPCHHDMWGQGPMQSITTQRHDYVPKPCVLRESCKPPPKFHCVEEPFENRTVNRMSYLNPGRVPPPDSFAPTRCYEKPAAKMEGSTTHKMSYQPVCAPAPQRPPWACKGQYQKPCQKLDGTTVYRSSFLPPGEDCTEYIDPCAYGDCKPCSCICPAECIATDPCACNFPRAACCS